MRSPSWLAIVLCVGALAAPAARAEPTTIRVATAAPDGTGWARLFRAMARDVATESNGEVALKWYFGGIAGSEGEMLDRMRRGQLDGVMSGGMLCMRLAPSMRVLRLLGLFQSREEAAYVMGRLRPIVDEEFAKNGYHNMGEAGLGSDILFTRTPVRSLAELTHSRLWVWDLDELMRAQLQALGLPAVPLPVEQASRAYEEGRTDGFIAVPTAALAFQWSTATRYMAQLHLGFLTGCMIMTNRAFDPLSVKARSALTVSVARFGARLEDLGRSQDAALLDKLFAKQGLQNVPISRSFAADFFDRAHTLRDQLPDSALSRALIERVVSWLADYRAEHQLRSAPHR